MAKRDSTDAAIDTMKVGLNDLADTLNEVVDEQLRSSGAPQVSESNDKNYVREYELENEVGSLFLTQKEIGDVNCVVWDAALVLAKYLEKRCGNDEFLKGRRVIELGAGLGCVGLVAAFYGGDVTLTDLPGAYLQQLEYNVRSNDNVICKKGSAKAVALDWNDKNLDLGDFDVVLAADCVYYEESIPGLINTMIKISTPKTEIYLSQEDRSYSEIQKKVWENFCDEIAKHFKIEIIPQRDQHEEYRSGDIFLMRLLKL